MLTAILIEKAYLVEPEKIAAKSSVTDGRFSQSEF